MSNLKDIKNIIDQFPLDLTMEVVLADLIESGIDIEKIVLRPIGLFERSHQYDIRRVELHYEGKTGKIDYAYLDICREGLYDALPESLFHEPLVRKSFKSKEELMEESRVQRIEEQEARKFFEPFENEFYQQRIALELEERRALVDFSGILFKKFWGLDTDFDERQIGILLYVLPIAHRIVGNLDLTALCFKAILEEAIVIEKIRSEPQKVDKKQLKKMGQFNLGVDFVVGNQFNDTLPNIEIKIGPVAKAHIGDYLKGGAKYKTLHRLYDYFLPVEAEIKTTVLVQEKEKDFILKKEKNDLRLGYTSLII